MAGTAGDAGGLVGGGLGSMFGPIGSALGQGLGKGLGSALGGGDAGPTITTATAATYGTTLGNDGWTINFGGSQVAMPSINKAATYPDQTPNPLGTTLNPQQAGMGASTALIVVVVAVIAWKIYRRAS